VIRVKQTDPTPRVRRMEVRRRILAAAAKEFAERGIHATRLEDVAAAAGFTRGAVYSNFAGKDDLIAAVIADRVDGMTGKGLGMTLAAGAGLPALAAAYLASQVKADTNGHRLALETLLYASRDDDLRERILGPRKQLRAAVADWLREYAKQSGVELPLPPDVLAVTLIALVNGIASEYLADPTSAPLDALAQAIVHLVPAPVTR
jgi:AcrR family transcriptional regulator